MEGREQREGLRKKEGTEEGRSTVKHYVRERKGGNTMRGSLREGLGGLRGFLASGPVWRGIKKGFTTTRY